MVPAWAGPRSPHCQEQQSLVHPPGTTEAPGSQDCGASAFAQTRIPGAQREERFRGLGARPGGPGSASRGAAPGAHPPEWSWHPVRARGRGGASRAGRGRVGGASPRGGTKGPAGPPPGLAASPPPPHAASRPPRLRPRSPLPVPAKMASPAAARALLRDLALRPRLLAARSQVSGARLPVPSSCPGGAALRPGRRGDPHLRAARAGPSGTAARGPSLGAARLSPGAGGPELRPCPVPSAPRKFRKSSPTVWSPRFDPLSRSAAEAPPPRAREGHVGTRLPTHQPLSAGGPLCRLGAPSWRETQ